jgi:hypothetical protein
VYDCRFLAQPHGSVPPVADEQLGSWFVSPLIAPAFFGWMIVYDAITSEGLHTNSIARLADAGESARAVVMRWPRTRPRPAWPRSLTS